jgi:hypothetical protein
MERATLIDALATVGAISVLEARRCGSGLWRPAGLGPRVVIGPVVARDQADAKAMIATLAAQCEGQFTRIDVTLASGLSPWLESIGLPRVDEVVAMARGGAPVQPAPPFSPFRTSPLADGTRAMKLMPYWLDTTPLFTGATQAVLRAAPMSSWSARLYRPVRRAGPGEEGRKVVVLEAGRRQCRLGPQWRHVQQWLCPGLLRPLIAAGAGEGQSALPRL